jgi:hypothetical protein
MLEAAEPAHLPESGVRFEKNTRQQNLADGLWRSETCRRRKRRQVALRGEKIAGWDIETVTAVRRLRCDSNAGRTAACLAAGIRGRG